EGGRTGDGVDGVQRGNARRGEVDGVELGEVVAREVAGEEALRVRADDDGSRRVIVLERDQVPGRSGGNPQVGSEGGQASQRLGLFVDHRRPALGVFWRFGDGQIRDVQAVDVLRGGCRGAE